MNELIAKQQLQTDVAVTDKYNKIVELFAQLQQQPHITNNK
jgi:hypothetical protein